VWNDTGSGYLETGQAFFIGPAPFDTHPIWDLVAWTPGRPFSLTLKIHDLNGIYTDSNPLILTFTPQSAPGPFSIRIQDADALHATVSWTTNAVGWYLESSASPDAGTWAGITNSPAVSGTNFSLSVDTAAPRQFFRLHKQ